MNPIKSAKEFITLSAATAFLKVSTLATNTATSEIKEATRLLQSTEDISARSAWNKHLRKGMKYAKYGKSIRNFAFQIHPAPSK